MIIHALTSSCTCIGHCTCYLWPTCLIDSHMPLHACHHVPYSQACNLIPLLPAHHACAVVSFHASQIIFFCLYMLVILLYLFNWFSSACTCMSTMFITSVCRLVLVNWFSCMLCDLLSVCYFIASFLIISCFLNRKALMEAKIDSVHSEDGSRDEPVSSIEAVHQVLSANKRNPTFL